MRGECPDNYNHNGILHFGQSDLESCRPSSVRYFELHVGLLVDVARHLHVDGQPYCGLTAVANLQKNSLSRKLWLS